MVWQLPTVDNDKMTNNNSSNDDVIEEGEEMFESSPCSSSPDLDSHAPGSGVVTADSEENVFSFNVDNEEDNQDSYANWNKDVESMLNRVQGEKEKEHSPKEDFVGNLKTATTD